MCAEAATHSPIALSSREEEAEAPEAQTLAVQEEAAPAAADGAKTRDPVRAGRRPPAARVEAGTAAVGPEALAA